MAGRRMTRKDRADFRAKQKAAGMSKAQIDRMLAAADEPAKGKGITTGAGGGSIAWVDAGGLLF